MWQPRGFVSLWACAIAGWPPITRTYKERTGCCNEQFSLLPLVSSPQPEPGFACYHHHPALSFGSGLEHVIRAMASGGGSSLLETPGAWISKESDPELSTPVPLTPPSSIQPAYISTSLKESPTFPPSCDPLPLPLVPIAVHSTPRISYPTLGPRESDPRVRKATLVMPVGVKTTAEATLHVRGT